MTVFTCSMLTLFAFSSFLSNIDKESLKNIFSSVNMAEEEEIIKIDSIAELKKEGNVTKKVIVYDGMTLNELTEKLNRSLKSTIAGKGDVFASYSLERGVDPYLAVSIMLLETGCNWSCSSLMRKCNNVGGQKGSPSCDGGSYRAYPSLDEGIKGFIDNIADNYYAYGLTTPEAMNKKYAESNMWAIKVNNYISSVKAK
nr:MAG TPA: Mannosyl-glycoprotein endo-beta-N-acetylglucosaminidase [Caudoviricetes sp.]